MKLTISTSEYHTRNELSFSTLSRFVQYDVWGQRTTNYLSYLYPPKREESDVMLTWTLVDAILTEWLEYTEWAENIGEYMIVSRRTGKYEKEINQSLAQEVYDKVNAVRSIPALKELFDTAEKQVVLTASKYNVTLRGKLDLLSTTWVVDLKCSGLTIASWEKDFFDPRTKTPSSLARVVRQLAFYKLLCQENNIPCTTSRVVLAASDWVKYYEVPQSTIDKAMQINEADIINLLEQNEQSILTTFPEQVEATKTSNALEELANF